MKALAVLPWPGPGPATPPVPVPEDGLLVIGVRTSAVRGEARAQVRLALREALAAMAGLLDAPGAAGDIGIVSHPGTPPRLTGLARWPLAGCSISHERGYALAAVNLHGAVGVDLMDASAIADHAGWQATAADYLGPAVCARLRALPPADLPRAYAQAWAEREAWLKYQGGGLAEWSASEPAPPAAIALILPFPHLAGALHRAR